MPSPSPNVVWAALDESRPTGPQLHCWENAAYRPIGWDEWRRDAFVAAAALRRLGVGPGSCVAAILSNTYDACAAVIGCWIAGGMLASLPPMRRGQSLDDYRVQLRRLCAQCHADLMLVDSEILELVLAAEPGPRVERFAALKTDPIGDPTPIEDDAAAFVQYSSGSTSDPKGIVLTMRAICEQQRMLIARQRVDTATRTVSWLPLSHDMGLFGCLIVSWVSGMQLFLSPPERFLRKPTTWLDDAGEVGATRTATPNFGLMLAAMRAQQRPPKAPLRFKTIALGGERVEWPTLELAMNTFEQCGLTWQALTPAYGLGEATLAVSMKRPSDMPHRVTVDAEHLARGELVFASDGTTEASDVVSCGPPLDGVEVGTDRGGFGRIWIRSKSLFDRYLGHSADPRPERGERAFQTEDLGFVHDGELYVVGRTDDMIPFGGRNLYARDVERRVERLDGVRRGCCVLVAHQNGGLPSLALLAEPSRDAPRLDLLADQMVAAAFQASGVRVAECVFITPGQLPKTPSGKLQRFRCRELLLSESPAVITRVAERLSSTHRTQRVND